MGLLNKKVPYPHENFLLSACQFTASSQGNGKFMEFVHLHGADSISQKSPKFYQLMHYFTYSPKFFFANSLFCLFIKVFHHQSFPLYGIIFFDIANNLFETLKYKATEELMFICMCMDYDYRTYS